MTTFQCNSVSVLQRLVGLAVLAAGMLLTSVAQAQEESVTLFDGYAVTFLSISEYTNPADQQPGHVMQVIVPALSAEPSGFVPVADNLFEEVFLPLLAQTDVTHAMIIQWRPEAEGASRTQYGEDVHYQRGSDGIWARTSYPSQEPEPSSYGRLDAAEAVVIAGQDVMVLPPSAGYLYRLQSDVILVRCALAIDVVDNEAVGEFAVRFIAAEGQGGALGEAMEAHPDAALVFYISNVLPVSRFQSTLTRSLPVPREVVERALTQERVNP